MKCLNQLHAGGKFKGEILKIPISKRTAHRISSLKRISYAV